MKNITIGLILGLILFIGAPAAHAQEVLGMHMMNIHELDVVQSFFEQLPEAESGRYITIPLTLDDLDEHDEWQRFFDQAQDHNLEPIVRLATRVDGASWQAPNRREIVNLIAFLEQLDWPSDQKHIIVFNEVNHAKEWGDQIDPAGYGDVLRFTAQWAHATDEQFVVLPAAMDLAASNTRTSQEAFSYLAAMYEFDSEIFTYIDAWNSHSYPNPGFSSSPTRTGKDSLRGYQFELAFLEGKTVQELPVYITETGWEANTVTTPWLESYYTYALQHIWSDPRVVAVTPFVFKGSPGPFSGFSFIDANDQPTSQFTALKKAIEKIELDS